LLSARLHGIAWIDDIINIADVVLYQDGVWQSAADILLEGAASEV